MSDAPEPNAPTEPPRRVRRGLWIGLGVVAGVIALAALGGLIFWAITSGGSRGTGAGTEAVREDWASAMSKAGVEATLPPEPTDIRSYRAEGAGHPFDATFTAGEATALLRVYTFSYDSGQGEVSIGEPSVAFPSDGVVELTGDVSFGENTAGASIEGPVSWTADGIQQDGEATVKVEGFSIGGDRGAQAAQAAVLYGNAYLQAAPGLEVQQVEIRADGVRVKGVAPDRLVFEGR